MRDINKETMLIIKNKAKSLGLTQAILAKKLKVSLPTIKRWFGGGTITLESLGALVNEVGLSLTDVFSSIEKSPIKTFQYSLEQEHFFSLNPDFLAYFDNLLRGISVRQIEKKFKISEKKSIQYLSKLDKLKLIQWFPKNNIRLLVNGEPKWRIGGPLDTKLREDIFNSFIKSEDKNFTHFYLHDYLPEDSEAILKKIQEIIELAKRSNNRAKFNIEKSKPMGLYISLQNFRWEIDKYLLS